MAYPYKPYTKSAELRYRHFSVFAQPAPEPEKEVERDNLAHLLFAFVSDKRDREIVKLRLADFTLKEIGDMYGITGPRVREIELRAYRQMKAGYKKVCFYMGLGAD